MEQLKNLGPKAHKWLHTMLNTCFIENKIPKIWRQSKIIAILKPGKDSAIPKNYRPISLLCHTFKLYERLILNRVSPLLEQHLIKEQAGFRPGKSCTSQLLNLTQHIEDGYQRGMITGTAFVDLSAAYDTVVVYPLPWPLLVGGVRCSRLWSTSQLLRPSGQQCSHSGGVCPQIQGRQCGAYVGAVEEMMCVVCVDVTEGA